MPMERTSMEGGVSSRHRPGVQCYGILGAARHGIDMYLWDDMVAIEFWTIGKDALLVLAFIVGGIICDRFTMWLLDHLHRNSKARAALRAIEAKDGPQSEREAAEAKTLAIEKRTGRIAAIINAIRKPLHVFCVTVGCSLGVLFIDPPKGAEEAFKIIHTALVAISMWCLVWFMLNLITDFVTPLALRHAKKSGMPVAEMLVPLLMSFLRVALMVIGVLFVAQNMGYSITSFLAALGLGGAAIALASKDTISNIFGSFVILFDHPFEIGDWVTINGVSGYVEDISIRSTKIRTFDDTLVAIPNQMLATTQIDRRGKKKTKMDCNFGVLYSTTPEQIRKIVLDIEKYIESHPDNFETTKHFVHFNGFGDCSLDISVVAYTKNTTYKQHVKLKQDFLLAIIDIVRNNGSDFAFPTRTLAMPTDPIRIKLDEE